jgi:hypothetical protein
LLMSLTTKQTERGEQTSLTSFVKLPDWIGCF